MRHETKESLLERESKFYARDIMTRELSFVNSEDSVRVAATRMEQVMMNLVFLVLCDNSQNFLSFHSPLRLGNNDVTSQDNVGFLLVRQEETGRLFGILTDRDLVTRVLAADRDPNTTKVLLHIFLFV
jgi:CBS domain-containing protein